MRPSPNVPYWAAFQRSSDDGSPVLPGAYFGVTVDVPSTDPRAARVFTAEQPALEFLASLPARDMGGRLILWEVAQIFTNGSPDHWYLATPNL